MTDSLGVHDYIHDEKTGLFCTPKDANDLSQKFEALWNEPAKTKQLSQAGYAFANQYCTEKTAINYFNDFLKRHTS